MPEPAREPRAKLPARGALLGFDFGLARIGVATGELETRSTAPLRTISHDRRDARFAAIAALIKEWQPVGLVVGLPTRRDGSRHEMSAACERFANQLHGRFGLPVFFSDETLSSHAAEQQLRSSGLTDWRKRKSRLDSAAARIILQHFLDHLDHEPH